MFEPLSCEDCGGTGVDPGSLYEPEPCPPCQGSGRQLVELDTRSSLYGKRKPMGAATALNPPTVGELSEQEQGGQYGD